MKTGTCSIWAIMHNDHYKSSTHEHRN